MSARQMGHTVPIATILSAQVDQKQAWLRGTKAFPFWDPSSYSLRYTWHCSRLQVPTAHASPATLIWNSPSCRRRRGRYRSKLIQMIQTFTDINSGCTHATLSPVHTGDYRALGW